MKISIPAGTLVVLAASNHTGMHTHFNRDERAVIASGLRTQRSYQTIADELGRDKGAVWREVRRNKDTDGVYRARSAARKARQRRTRSKEAYRLLENTPHLADTAEALMDPLISPECIAHLFDIHHQTIYSWVSRSRPDLRERLPQRGRKRRRYGSKREVKQGWTSAVRSIAERPDTDGLSWEGDTIKGSSRARVLTHVEQSSLYTRADRLSDGTADSVHAVLKAAPLHGMATYDRGSEFALWRLIERDTGTTVFFAEPHHPWQRGKNENTNGRLRRPYPKRFDFDTLSDEDLQATVDLMNHTPRKSLDWQMPAVLFQELQGRCNSG